MLKSEVVPRQNGIGYLVLKDGIFRQVQWEIELLDDGSLGDGCIRGDEQHLAAAAAAGCAKLLLSINVTAAIAISSHNDRGASFTTVLISSKRSVFQAQTIVGSSPTSDSYQFSIEFSAADGERLIIIVPTIIMRDYLPVLKKTLPPASPQSAPTTFFRVPETWKAATTATYPFVCLTFDDDEPLALTLTGARELAAELTELATKIEKRSQTAHLASGP